MLWCTVRKSAFVLILALFLINYNSDLLHIFSTFIIKNSNYIPTCT